MSPSRGPGGVDLRERVDNSITFQRDIGPREQQENSILETVTSVPSSYLAMTGRYIERPIE
jgi:hypothetical protein